MRKKDIQKYALAKSYDNDLYADHQHDVAVVHRDHSYAREREREFKRHDAKMTFILHFINIPNYILLVFNPDSRACIGQLVYAHAFFVLTTIYEVLLHLS